MSPDVLRSMLEARSVAVVGASDRPGSFGHRLATEALRSPAGPDVRLVNPRHREVLGQPCFPALSEVPGSVDLVLLGVPDDVLVEQLECAAARGDRGAVIFGTAYGLGVELARTAQRAGMALCGGGCMGFINVAAGMRAIGYLERYPLRIGPVALITHSGSVFSAMLRTHRAIGYSLAVSSGQELVTTAADYLTYALELAETRVAALVLETLRDADGIRSALATAAARDVPVVALTVGGSPTGRVLVNAHSGAVAGDDAAWEALFDAYGVHRVADLDEMADTLELFAIGRRANPSNRGIASVHDSGAERAHVADMAERHGVPFAPLAETTRTRLSGLLAPWLIAENPLDVWGTGDDTRALLASCLSTLAGDPGVGVAALAVDLIEEYDGDDSYLEAALDAHAATEAPLVLLSNIAAAVDQARAAQLRSVGIPVLEGTSSGLRALHHLLDAAQLRRTLPTPAPVDAERVARWRARFQAGALAAEESLQLLAEYGMPVATTVAVESADEVVAAADRLGYPVVLKTAELGQHHKTEVAGVILGVGGAEAVLQSYAQLARRLGPRVVVQAQAADGVELALGVVRDPSLGPLVVLAAGGTLVEFLTQRVVALPPLDSERAGQLLTTLSAARLLDGVRGRPACDRRAVVSALVSVSQLATELGDVVAAVDINPLIAGPTGVVAVDALVLLRGPTVPR
ncbi:MAG: acetate--CoA ligase family protein [Nocardioidaceae bacterium]